MQGECPSEPPIFGNRSEAHRHRCALCDAAGLGLGALMMTHSWSIEVLRYLGAAYLLFLAIRSARSAFRKSTRELEPARAGIGFRKGASSPCTFCHPTYKICMAVHGDEFVSAGSYNSLRWLDEKLKGHFQIKTEVLGEDKALLKEARLLNRVIRWRKDGIVWEPDPRHCELVWRELGMDPKVTKLLVAPGVRESAKAKHSECDEKGKDYLCEECNMVHAYGEAPRIV